MARQEEEINKTAIVSLYFVGHDSVQINFMSVLLYGSPFNFFGSMMNDDGDRVVASLVQVKMETSILQVP